MHPLSITVIFVASLYLAINGSLQYRQTTRRKRAITTAQTDWLQAEQQCQEAKGAIFEQMTAIYGQQATELVSQQKIWIGMPQLLLPMSFGRPDDTKDNFYRNDKTQKLYFGQYRNRLGNAKYTLEVIIENGVVAGWKDL